MKPRSLAVFIGVAAVFLAIALGVGGVGPTRQAQPRRRQPRRGASRGQTPGQAGQSLASAAHPGPPRRVGRGPAIPRGARRLGALAAAAKISVDVVLAPSSPSALADYAANVSSPGNALYHHYLTVSQFAATFGPSAAAVSAVEASLRASGLTPGPLSANHLLLPVAATAKQFATAFSVAFDQYQLSGGRVAFANTAAPLLAGAAALRRGGHRPRQPVDAAAPRQSEHRQASYAGVCAGRDRRPAAVRGRTRSRFTRSVPIPPTSFASAYGFSSLYGAGDEGAGVTIGLLELEDNQPSDVSAYQACYSTSATVSYFPQRRPGPRRRSRRGRARHRGHHRAGPQGGHRRLPVTGHRDRVHR